MELTDHYDAVIVGSGAGGAAAAWRLTTSGLKVLVLEAGPTFDPQVDYPLNKPGWEVRGFPVKTGSQTRITYGDLGRPNLDYPDLTSWSLGGLPWQHTRDRRNTRVGYSYVMGVGGSTLHYVGEAHRLHPDAFQLSSLTGAGINWPTTYAELEPYYSLAEDRIGVAGDDSDTDRWRSHPYPLPAHPLSPGAKTLVQAGARVGQNWTINPRAALSESYRGRPPCNYCGQCSRGCPLGDKGSVDVTFLKDAMETGLLTLISEAVVTRLLAGRHGKVTHLDVIHKGTRRRIETPTLVLAAGAVQTPRLLLMSADSEQPLGLANSSDQVGRNFMETLYWQSAGLVPGLSGGHLGLPSDAVFWGPSRPGQLNGTAGGFRLNHATAEIGFTGPVSYATRLIGGFGKQFKDAVRQGFGSGIAVGAIGQVIADERSRVTLDTNARDALGLPVARISSVLTKESLQLLRHMATETRKVIKAAGAAITEETGSMDEFRASHVFGTARMGTASGTSVVTARGRSHDHPNLWIADASVFPTSGGGESPGLTIMSLALRTADAIMAQ